jgi:hypothetical protein
MKKEISKIVIGLLLLSMAVMAAVMVKQDHKIDTLQQKNTNLIIELYILKQ